MSETVYEVEMKFPVRDAAAVESRLRSIGAVRRGSAVQLDRYFNHPCRDFSATDEALRLRRAGERVELTYKGPRVDATTKTRRECSLPVFGRHADDEPRIAVEAWTELVLALGFRVVAEVSKERTVFSLERDCRSVEIAVDAVSGLGTYVELEILCDAGGVADARGEIVALARELGLADAERRSYLELLLLARNAEQRPKTPTG